MNYNIYEGLISVKLTKTIKVQYEKTAQGPAGCINLFC